MTDFGRDTWCADSLQPGRMVSGVRAVALRTYRRLTTPKGTLRGGRDELDFGLDLAGLCGAAATKELENALGPRVATEVAKDPMIKSATCTVASSRSGAETSWSIRVDAKTGVGPFALVLQVSDVTVDLLGLEVPS